MRSTVAISPGSAIKTSRKDKDPALHGWIVVARKELADHLLSARFAILLVLLGLSVAGSVYAAAGEIRDAAPAATGTPALFLKLFTIAPERIPTFLTLVGLLAPVLGIAFGFDAINGERAQGTLPRLVSQPIHRDDVINGKFVAGLSVVGVVLTSLTVLVAGVGMLRLGLVPTGEEVVRMILWLAVTLAYVGFWLAFAMLCSVVVRRAATSALIAIAAWLTLTLFGGLLFGIVTNTLAPVPQEATAEEIIANARLEQRLNRLSPAIAYEEATAVLLDPEIRSVGFLLPAQVDRAIQSELPVGQSFLLAWPQAVGLLAATVMCFAGAYVLFMRQEIRA